MGKITWEQRLTAALIGISLLIFAAKVVLIGDAGESNTLSELFNNLGFLPIEILIVTLVIDRLLAMRAKKEQQEKMKMVVGLFFSEIGSRLLHLTTASDPDVEKIRNILTVQKTWTPENFSEAKQKLASCRFAAAPSATVLIEIRDLLDRHHDFLLRLIENPVLLEQNSISKLLQALFHLGEELASRGNIAELPKTDIAHLDGDVNRVYRQLMFVWIDHMEYLAAHYPYLLSLSIRKSPFTEECDVIVRE